MVYDDARGVTLLFGGADGQRSQSAETWQWDGRAWTRLSASGPPARMGAGFAFDSKRQQAVLFGGGAAGKPLGDTWTWDGVRWRR